MWNFVSKGRLCSCWILIVAVSQINQIMAVKRTVPTIDSTEDLDSNLSDFLDKNKKLAIFLDFDGTLAELSSDPITREMPKDVEDTLRRLANNPRIFMAVITGRGLVDIKNKVKIPNFTFSGNHGIEIENVDGTRSDFEVPQSVKDEYRKLIDHLQSKVAKHGAWVEDKNASLTFHYGTTPKEFIESLRNEAIDIIEAHGWLSVDAHNAVEGKPPVNWNKGEATKYILQKNFGDNWQTAIKAIYIGDDTTDEDAMKVLQGKGKTFRIAADPTFETYADFRLPSCDKTHMVLKWFESHYA